VLFSSGKYDYTEKVLTILLKGTDKKEKKKTKSKKF
jgi:outer membrane protein